MKFDPYETGQYYDEMFGAGGQPRASARPLASFIESLPPGELLRRQRAAETALLQMGITFNVYGDTAGAEKIFPFDMIPRIVGPREWDRIERGLRQRIQALNLFIDDIYRGQKIVKDGIVPKTLIRSADSLRSQCVGLKPPRGIWCHVTGTDLIRHRDGEIYVLEDNLRCPSGVSYVLENRAIMQRTFPQVFLASRVRPVSSYPSRLRDMLEYLAPDDVEHPRVVVLTPGPGNSAYFEHAFLAQQMGIELVEGRDLTVSGGRVWMRTTKGHEPVDVIYRRIDDDFLDPKAFRSDSVLGVPGLMEVYRAGRVALANAPGTGIADDKVIYAFVPRMIKYYLAQDPILPNVPTHVCADEKERRYVLEHLGELVVKVANESGGYGMLIGPASTKEEQAEFARRIAANPRNYIAQPTLSLSRVPTIVEDHFEGRHVDLRPYILYGKDIFVLPGGLTRVALRKGSLVVNSSQGGGSKDTWVLTDDAAGRDRAGPDGSPPPDAMLSRVADSIYWMSRYIERAENVARFVDVTLHLMLDLPEEADQPWQPLVDATGDTEDFAKRVGAPTQANVLKFLTFDMENSNSIVACLRSARENARSIREIISSEMWEQLNQFYLMTQSAPTEVQADLHGFFERVKLASHLFAGVTDATMTHAEAWHFCQLGRMLERADKTSRILDVKYYLLLPSANDIGTPFDDIQWAALLRSASAFEMFRKKHGRISPDRVVQFLLLDAEFPRAVRKCLDEARRSLHAISGTPAGLFGNAAEQGLGQLCSELAFATVAEIIGLGLHEYVDVLQKRMNAVSQGIFEAFFAPKLAPPPPKAARRPGATQSQS